MRLRDFLIECLTAPQTARLNFRFGPLQVYPTGFSQDVARAISSGVIRLTTDGAALGMSAAAAASFARQANAAYTPDPAPGRRHVLWVNPSLCARGAGEPQLAPMGRIEAAALRGTLMHECTHALQDYQRAQTTPDIAEAAAYLVGAITARQYGYALGAIANPRASGRAYALSLADRMLGAGVQHSYVVAADDVRALRALVATGSSERYLFNGL